MTTTYHLSVWPLKIHVNPHDFDCLDNRKKKNLSKLMIFDVFLKRLLSAIFIGFKRAVLTYVAGFIKKTQQI